MKTITASLFALVLSAPFALADGCTENKKPQCLAQQAKLGTQNQSSVSTQAHKLIYVELMRPHFLLGPFCLVDAFKLFCTCTFLGSF